MRLKLNVTQVQLNTFPMQLLYVHCHRNGRLMTNCNNDFMQDPAHFLFVFDQSTGFTDFQSKPMFWGSLVRESFSGRWVVDY